MTMIRDEKKIEDICLEALLVAVDLLQSPPELAFIRLINQQTDDTSHLCMLDRTYELVVLKTQTRGITGRAIATHSPQLIGDVTRDKDYIPLSTNHSERSELVVPVMLGGVCAGVMNFESQVTEWFTADDIEPLLSLARLVALASAIEVQRFKDDAGIALGMDPAGKDLKSQMTQILDEVLGLFPPSPGLMAEILGFVPDSRELITLVIRPDTAAGLPIRLREGEGVIGQVLKTGRPFVSNVVPGGQDITHLLNTRSAVVLPIFDQSGQMLGVLNIESRTPDQLDQSTITLLQQRDFPNRLTEVLGDVSREPASSEDVAERLLKRTQEQVLGIVDPDDLDETYYAILTNAAQLTGEIDVVGGIVLLQEEVQDSSDASVPVTKRWVRVIARLGDYAEEDEWSLDKPSITRRAIEQRRVQLVNNVSNDPDYRSVGSRFASGSVLNVPLIDQDRAIGVLDLVSPVPNAFTSQDVDNLQRLALSVVQAIRRASDIAQKERASQQLRYATRIQQMIQPLFSAEAVDIAGIRQQAVDQILTWTLAKTDSELGLIVLAQQTVNKQTELVVYAQKGEMAPNAPSRWPTTQGVTGRAFTSKQTIIVPDVASDPDYITLFPGAHSEMCVPLKRGNDVLGVLNVESDTPRHYTSEHRQWAEFLAEQLITALTAIDVAQHTQRELSMSNVSDAVDVKIDEMRELTQLNQIRGKRDEALQFLLDAIVRLTGASSGTVLLSADAYHFNGSKDFENGQLVEVIESPRRDPPLPEKRYFSVNDGLSGQVFLTEKPVIFNSLATRPPKFFSYADDPNTVESELAVPIFEGPYIVGVLDLESAAQGTFIADNAAQGIDAGQIASDIIVSAKVRMEELQADEQREFEINILRRRTPDLDAYMGEVLSNAARLTETRDGLVEILLVRYFPSAQGPVARRDILYRKRIANGASTIETQPSPTGEIDHDHPIVAYPVYQSVIADKESWLSLDTRKDAIESQDIPWPDMRSFICTPIMYPVEGNSSTEVYGLLTLASPVPVSFNDSDDEVLYLFSQTIAIGLQNIALLQAREDLIRQITHDFGKALVPLTRRIGTTNVPIQHALAAQNLDEARRDLVELQSQIGRIGDLVFLSRDLLYWFVDLFSQNRALQQEMTMPLAVGEIVDDMRDSMNALGEVISGRKVNWQLSPNPIYIAGSETREKLIRAVLFKYIENALKYATSGDVLVSISSSGLSVTFAVRSTGPLVPMAERDSLFELRVQASNVSEKNASGGLGLSQVKEIADALGGKVAYVPEEPDQNVFAFQLPGVVAPTMRRER